MADDRHECPAPGCIVQVPHHILACRVHWFSIPKATRDRLWREYDDNFGETSYFEARGECLRALGVPEDEISPLNAGVAPAGRSTA